MKTFSFTDAVGDSAEIPMFDPVVAYHFSTESSYVETLLDEINKGLYASLFADRKNLTFLDIGANIGLVSLYAASVCSRIVALEPATETFEVLRAMTGKTPQIEIMRAALAPNDGPVTFYENNLNTTASSTVNTYGKRTSVDGLKLSSILRIHQLEHVDVAKLDCEGAEGASLTFDELKEAAPLIDTWWIENHNCPNSAWESKLGRLVEYFSRLGYYRQEVNGMRLLVRKP